LDGVDTIPAFVKRISFLDSNYGYETNLYYGKFKAWLLSTPGAALNVFAYNDSVALLNGKPFVSATGGTWYRSRLMISDFSKDFSLVMKVEDSITTYYSDSPRIGFFLKENPLREIYHTVQVERNGFIHSLLWATRYNHLGYHYYWPRAYAPFIPLTLNLE
jgi:hypothetical protein